MIKRNALVAAAAAATMFTAPMAHAQVVSATMMKPAYSGKDQSQRMLLAGTIIRLRMAEDLTTRGEMLWEGRRFRLEVADPVIVDGLTLIPAGSIATGEITHVRNKASLGRSGRIGARLISVNVDGRAVRLSGAIGDKGVTGTAGLIIAPFLATVITGTSAKVPMGTLVSGYVDENIPYVAGWGRARLEDGNGWREASSPGEMGRIVREVQYREHIEATARRVPAVSGVDD